MARTQRTTKADAAVAAALTFRPVTTATLNDFERLFGAPGAPHYCWCMAWRRTSEETKHLASADAKRQMVQRITAGVPVGLLAYAGDEPVAWVSIAPRDTFRLRGPEAGPDETVWSISCFFVPRKLRGQGTVHALLAAAVNHARGEGATMWRPTQWTRPRRATATWVSSARSSGPGSPRSGRPARAAT